MENRALFLTLALSLLTFFFTAFLGSYNSFTLKIIIGTCLYFSFVFLFALKYPIAKAKILFVFLAPLILAIVFFNIIDYKKTWVSIPSNLFLLLGSLGGYFYSKNKKLVIPLALIILLGLWEIGGQKLFTNKMNYGTFDQKILSAFPSVQLADSSTTILKTTGTDKIIILDFWNSGCAPCFRLFPLIDSINRKIDTTKYDIRLVNVPFNGEKEEDNFRILNRFPYNLKQLFAKDKSVADSFRIISYPTTLIIKNNKILFRGEFENAIKEMSKL